ncbi:MAG: hypothetical protein NTW16_15630 [Bacteroidetes bacterium]|nr:hypothetical protein [Bacteroidota bacterium]
MNRFLMAILFVIMMPVLIFSAPQEPRVNQKKIDRERIKKQKQFLKEYDQAVRRHNKRQSKATKESMRKTQKQSKKVTPLKH